jgi:histone-lysine N-methyltransferase SETMAR
MGQTINAEYYSSLLVKLKDILKEKRLARGGHQGGRVLAQCPGSPGTCDPEETVLPGFLSLDHPPYSPDLAPSDYHLFPGLKKHHDRHFSSEPEVIAAAETWLDGQTSEFLSRLQKLRATG